MSIFKSTAKLTSLSLLTICAAVGIMYVSQAKPVQAIPDLHEVHTTEFQRAFFEASKVYGKAGCGDQALAEMTARHAIDTGLPPQLIAAMAVIESYCNPQAISNRGAVGLTQVVPKIWGKQFDFSKINLFNTEDNMTVGTSILSKLVKEHGIRNGLARYYGTGADDIGLGGAGYANKILQLTGKL
jgi:soluble lytic murein transglycosylase-like protein